MSKLSHMTNESDEPDWQRKYLCVFNLDWRAKHRVKHLQHAYMPSNQINRFIKEPISWLAALDANVQIVTLSLGSPGKSTNGKITPACKQTIRQFSGSRHTHRKKESLFGIKLQRGHASAQTLVRAGPPGQRALISDAVEFSSAALSASTPPSSRLA